jgi:hypothetical protein
MPTRPITDRRIRKTEPFTKSLVYNRYVITSMADLDGTFGRWLAEARAVGDGDYASRGVPGSE